MFQCLPQARRRQFASTSARAVRLLKIVDSEVLQAELDRRKVGSHIFNTEVRPLHAARAAAIDAALAQYGVESPDELAPGPPRKAYDSYARPRDGEPKPPRDTKKSVDFRRLRNLGS